MEVKEMAYFGMAYFERAVIWRSIIDGSLDRCRLSFEPGGLVIEGEVVTLVDGNPARATYRVACNELWETRLAVATWQEGTSVAEIRLEVDEEKRWWQTAASLRTCGAASMWTWASL